MKYSTKILLLSLSMIAFVGCDKASETLVRIPTVTLDCNSANTTACASSGSQTGRVIMTRSGCSNVDFEPIASGTVNLNCSSSGCRGSINSWRDVNGNPVSEIISGRMDLCGLMDFVGSNLKEDTGDVTSETSQSIQSNQTITLDAWDEVS